MSSVNLQRESRLKLLKEELETTKQMTMTFLKSLKRLTKKKTKKMKTVTLRAWLTLSLKSSLNEVNARTKASNFRKNAKKEALDKANDERKDRLLDGGFNPYEVFRREEIEKKIADKKVEMAATT